MKDEYKLGILFIVLTVIFTFIGSTLAYWLWTTNSSQQTAITLTVESGFICSADGGGNITSNDVKLAPAECTNQNYAIMREIQVNTIQDSDISVKLDMNLKVNSISASLTAGHNFKYALTTSASSCANDVVTTGDFYETEANDELPLLVEKQYLSSATNDTYYLWIWLDKAEINNNTQNQTFDLTLSGTCISFEPEPIVLPSPQMQISLNKNSYYVDDPITVTATVPQDASGSVTFTIGENEYSASITSGTASYTITGRILSGSREITAVYEGDANYSAGSTSATFTVSKKESTFSFTDDLSVMEGKPVKLTANFPSGATGTVTVTVSGYVFTAPLTNAKARVTIEGLPPGNYSGDITYSGDDKYLSSSGKIRKITILKGTSPVT